MDTSPRPPAAPRLSVREGTLEPCATLGPDLVGPDAMLADLDVADAFLAAHSSEFVELSRLRVRAGTLADSDWHRTTWVDCALEGVDAANACLVESGLRRVRFERSRLVGLQLAGCTLTDVSVDDSLMALGNLRFARLERVEVVDSDLTGADLSSATLSHVGFRGCRLDEATFTQARCSDVLLEGCTLVGLRGIEGLRGATVAVDSLAEVAQEMALALGLRLVVA